MFLCIYQSCFCVYIICVSVFILSVFHHLCRHVLDNAVNFPFFIIFVHKAFIVFLYPKKLRSCYTTNVDVVLDTKAGPNGTWPPFSLILDLKLSRPVTFNIMLYFRPVLFIIMLYFRPVTFNIMLFFRPVTFNCSIFAL